MAINFASYGFYQINDSVDVKYMTIIRILYNEDIHVYSTFQNIH